MPKITRKTFKRFAVDADTDDVMQIGSLRAGAPVTSKDPDVLQALSNYEEGWGGIVMGDNSPALEDMNAIQLVFAYMIFSIFEQGVPEYDDGTTYYTGSIVSSGGSLFVSIADDNIGNPLTDTTKWSVQRKTRKISGAAATTIAPTIYDEVLLIDANGATAQLSTVTLPDVATVALGKQYIIKNISPLLSSGVVKVQGTGGQTVEFNASIDLLSGPPVNESLTLISNGVNWSAI